MTLTLSCGGNAKCEDTHQESETRQTQEGTDVYQALHGSSTPTPSDYERDFFESWEAFVIIGMAAFLISCVLVLWIFTRTRLRYTSCCMPVVDSCAYKSDGESTFTIDLETGKIEGISWTLEELRDLDYFDSLSDTKSLGIISLESLRKLSTDTTRSTSNNRSRKTSVSSSQNASFGLLREDSDSNLEIFPNDLSRCLSRDSGMYQSTDSSRNFRRQSDDSQRTGQINISRKFSGGSLRRPSGDSLRNVHFSPSLKSFENILISKRPSEDSTESGLVVFSRKSSGESSRRPSGDSTGSGAVSILRKSSGASLRRPSGDSIDSDSTSTLTRSPGEKLGSSDILDSNKKAGGSIEAVDNTIKPSNGDSNESNNVKNPSKSKKKGIKKRLWSFGKSKESTGDSITILVGDNLRKYYEESSIENLHESNYLLIPKRRVSVGNLRTGQPLESIIETHSESPRDSVQSPSPKKTNRSVRFDSKERVAQCDGEEAIYRPEASENTTVK